MGCTQSGPVAAVCESMMSARIVTWCSALQVFGQYPDLRPALHLIDESPFRVLAHAKPGYVGLQREILEFKNRVHSTVNNLGPFHRADTGILTRSNGHSLMVINTLHIEASNYSSYVAKLLLAQKRITCESRNSHESKLLHRATANDSMEGAAASPEQPCWCECEKRERQNQVEQSRSF